MADLRLRINELPEELTPAPIDNIAVDGPSTRRTTLSRAADAVRPYSTEAQAREGLNEATTMTPLRVSQAIETLGGQRFASSQQGNKADSAVQPTLTITAGAGLTGGGTLAANRTLALSSTSLASLALADSAVQPARQVIAGAGLTGGGSLAADRTISLDATTQASLGRADSAVQPLRTVSAGTGLTGGGNLSADRMIALNAATIASLAKADSAVQPSRAVNAGAGLSGGGDLSTDRSLSLSTATQTSLGKADTAIQAPGGTAGQLMAKASSAPGDVVWVNVEGVTAVSYGPQSLTPEQQEQARTNISAYKKPTGNSGQFIQGDGTVQDKIGLPISAATQTALNDKLSMSSGGSVEGALRVNNALYTYIAQNGGNQYSNQVSCFIGDTIAARFMAEYAPGFYYATLIQTAYPGGSREFLFKSDGSFTAPGTIIGASKNFEIDHPVDPDNYDLRHCSTEAPEMLVEYRGTARLLNGRTTVNVERHFDVKPGTFDALWADAWVTALQNQDGFDRLKPSRVTGATFDILCENETSSDLVTWVVMARRNDPYVLWDGCKATGEDGKLIVEFEKETV